jgi:hypothetical protein
VTSPRTTPSCAFVAVFALVLAIALPRPAAAQKLDVRLGLWEVTMTSQMGGMPPVDTSKMTPQQRAQVEAAMVNAQKMGGVPQVMKQCLTKEKLSKGLFQDNRDTSCKQTVVTDTTTELGIKVACTAKDGETTTGEYHFQATSPESVKGSGQMTMGRGGQSMSASSTITAKWIGASCGDVK